MRKFSVFYEILKCESVVSGESREGGEDVQPHPPPTKKENKRERERKKAKERETTSFW